MKKQYADVLKPKMVQGSFEALGALDNDQLHAFVADAVTLCKPQTVKVCTDSLEDEAYIRQLSIKNGEERPLAMEGHTAHFDGYFDQGRDKEVTKYLVPNDIQLGSKLNQTERQAGLDEIRGLLEGQMAGRQMLVLFFCLGPTSSPFSISCVQITDSAYVGHSEYMLYRKGYEQFKRLGQSQDYFRFLHSAGKLENAVSVDVAHKRIYIDVVENAVYSVNTQYAGNTVGFKKLALRLAIRKADREGWLAEHMFLMGVHGPRNRVTFFAGAYPSACGKTSTAMIPGETILGDDLAHFRIINGQGRGVNIEAGIFGIIRDVNPKDDPIIYKVLSQPGEVIFGNVLIKDGETYWEGMGKQLPASGVNHAGQWTEGMKGPDGAKVDPSHKNARYTVRLTDLQNLDPRWNDPEGVAVGGVIFGGRDSDTCVPVQESFGWVHGVITMGASLESETTAATLGAVGVRSFNLMSNLDFLAIPLGKYIQNNLDFGAHLSKKAPRIFGTNYFLRGADGRYLNGMLDKSIWIKWMELRVHGDVDSIEAPTGKLPLYEDLKKLFQDVLKKEYTLEQYVQQFTIRLPENLAKIDRIEAVYRKDVPDAPAILFKTLEDQRHRLEKLRQAKGEHVSPLKLQN